MAKSLQEEQEARIEALTEALSDSNAALGKFVDLKKFTREPYETPLSAYDRGCKVLESEMES
jgi:hypothetical protein